MAATICPHPVTLTFDLLTLKSVRESHVTWGTPVQSFVFLGLLVFELEPMYATSDRRTDDGRRWQLDAPAPPLRGGGIIRHTIPPEVIIFEAVVAQVMPLLFDMGEIKKVSLKPGFEDCYWRAFKKRVPDGRSWVTETTSGEVSFGERLTQQRSVGRP